MKRLTLLFLSIIFISSVVSPVFAAQKTHQLTGNIMSIDVKKGEVSIKGQRGEHACSITKDTSIKIAGESKAMADLKVGDKVLCKYVEEESGMICKEMSVISDEKKDSNKEAKK